MIFKLWRGDSDEAEPVGNASSQLWQLTCSDIQVFLSQPPSLPCSQTLSKTRTYTIASCTEDREAHEVSNGFVASEAGDDGYVLIDTHARSSSEYSGQIQSRLIMDLTERTRELSKQFSICLAKEARSRVKERANIRRSYCFICGNDGHRMPECKVVRL